MHGSTSEMTDGEVNRQGGYSVIESITDLRWHHHKTVIGKHLSRRQAEELAGELRLNRPKVETGFGGPVYIVRPE